MGCFDGRGATSDEGSTAEIAKWLGAPVVLVVDARAMARSAGAIVLGFERFDPDLDLAGVVFNRVGRRDALAVAPRGGGSALPRRSRSGIMPRRDSLSLARAAPGAGHRGGARASPGTLLDELAERHRGLGGRRSACIRLARSAVQPSRYRAAVQAAVVARRPGPGSASPATSPSSSTTRRTSISCARPAPSWSSGARSPTRSCPTWTRSTWAAATPSCTPLRLAANRADARGGAERSR